MFISHQARSFLMIIFCAALPMIAMKTESPCSPFMPFLIEEFKACRHDLENLEMFIPLFLNNTELEKKQFYEWERTRLYLATFKIEDLLNHSYAVLRIIDLIEQIHSLYNTIITQELARNIEIMAIAKKTNHNKDLLDRALQRIQARLIIDHIKSLPLPSKL